MMRGKYNKRAHTESSAVCHTVLYLPFAISQRTVHPVLKSECA